MVTLNSTSLRLAWGCCDFWALKTNPKLQWFQNLSLCSQARNDLETVVSLTSNLCPWKTNHLTSEENSFELSLGMWLIQGFSFDLWPHKSSPLSRTYFTFTYKDTVGMLHISACTCWSCTANFWPKWVWNPHRRDRARPEMPTDPCCRCSLYNHPDSSDILDLGQACYVLPRIPAGKTAS